MGSTHATATATTRKPTSSEGFVRASIRRLAERQSLAWFFQLLPRSSIMLLSLPPVSQSKCRRLEVFLTYYFKYLDEIFP
ncbi:hypothetical protein [Nostoc sp. DedQUE04]|uniref:hypothetical protein n=1 Tax=Nostoc sp. DedQUE04 TaxID=3075390 RepID=UPI002AD44377|nr:hypothetical protein [Nostoc sp. DedQUE04]